MKSIKDMSRLEVFNIQGKVWEPKLVLKVSIGDIFTRIILNLFAVILIIF